MLSNKYKDPYILRHSQILLAPNPRLDLRQKGSFYFIGLKNIKPVGTRVKDGGKKYGTGLGKDQMIKGEAGRGGGTLRATSQGRKEVSKD